MQWNSRIREFFVSLGVAVQFLTVFPVPLRRQPTLPDRGRAVLFYPLVGLLLGALLAGFAQIATEGREFLTAALLLACWVIATGALHLDGLADCADVLLAKEISADARLRIMKDPHVGAIAVISICLLLILKFSAILQLLEQQAFLALLIVPMFARASVLPLIITLPYASPGGLADGFRQVLDDRLVWSVFAGCLLLAGLLSGFGTVLLVILNIVLIRKWAMRKLGGANGDVYGAMIELSETGLLVICAL